MAEQSTKSPEFQPTEPNETIATVIEDWLTTEKINSYDNNNAVLNEYGNYEASQQLAWNDTSNAFTNKGLAHYDRLSLRTREIAEENVNDRFLATQLFDALMALSGNYRLQCIVRATNKEGYMDLRYGPNALGIDIPAHVDRRLISHFGKLPEQADLGRQVVRFADIKLMTTTANEHRLELMKLFDRKRMVGTRKAIFAGRLVSSQALWLETTVDHILYSTGKNGGDLSQVPFLEPKTITKAELIYPLTGTAPYFTKD